MAAGAKAEREGFGCIGKENALLALHPFARCAIKPPKNPCAAMACESQAALFERLMEVGIRKIDVADHRV